MDANVQKAQVARFLRMIEMRERRVLVLESDKTIAGFITFSKSMTRPATCGEVMQLFVHPNCQRRGAGSLLLGEAERLMFFTFSEVHVWASRGNSANAIYENRGWMRTGREKEIPSSMAARPVPVVEYILYKHKFARWKAGISPWLQKGSVTIVLFALVIGMAWQANERRRPNNDGFGTLHKVVGSGGACLDGSPPAYYHRLGSVRNRSKWLLYFQGGGWCTFSERAWPRGMRASIHEHCVERARTSRGSTKFDPATNDFDSKSLFSRDISRNPAMHDWQIVLLRYCDGTFFASNVTEPLKFENATIHFRGAANVRAILEDLVRRRNFGSATDVVVAGCSAGGLAAPLSAGLVQTFAPVAFVAVLADSALFPDWSSAVGKSKQFTNFWSTPNEAVWSLDVGIREVFDMVGLGANFSGVVFEACLGHHRSAPWRCVFLEHLLPFVSHSFPTFVLQSRVDTSNIRSLANHTSIEIFSQAIGARINGLLASAGGNSRSWPLVFFP
eukprot:TRINITY_DN27760_c0_g1_i1.p1 TRINITY_DN27760_c0_g1~~TRINITY_DN27760_c0_g1_i1.p1  ORF type:complete len:572 (-),score=70.53 TRINITY_DN27760_c0_g1_i1:303-1808(-)